MKNINIKLHEYQKQILKKLCNVQSLRFNDLIIQGLESEHMNYHLKKLIDYYFVEKKDNEYMLTDKGKDYTNLMDDDVEFLEKQPKTSVLLHIIRINEKGIVEHLLSKRLRHPYIGKVGRLTGKVQFGETLEQAAKRELYEETGLQAKTIILEQIYHKLRYKEGGGYVQDSIFYKFFIKDVYGEFISRTEHQENIWVSYENKDNSKYDFFDGMGIDDRTDVLPLSFYEEDGIADGY